MSCPNWPQLAARRDLGEEAEAEWLRALAHLDGCESCRPAALSADPTLVFRRLPALAADEQEIAGMKQAVAALRRDRERARPARRRWRALQIAAANVAVLLGAAYFATHLAEAPELDPAAIPLVENVDPAFQAPVATLVGDVPAAQGFDRSSQDLRFEIRVARDGGGDLLAEGGGVSREGEEVTYDLGGGFEVSFTSGQILSGQRLPLDGFRLARQSADKSRQLPPREMFHATVNLWVAKPVTLVLAPEADGASSLVVTITCRPADGGEARPGP